MEHSFEDRQAEHGAAVPIGPAVSPRRPSAGTPLGALVEPLPPFVTPRRATVAAPPLAPPPQAVEPLAPVARVEAVEPVEPSLPEVPETMVAGDREDDLGLVRGAGRGLPESSRAVPAEGDDLRREEAPADGPAGAGELDKGDAAAQAGGETTGPEWPGGETAPEEAPALPDVGETPSPAGTATAAPVRTGWTPPPPAVGAAAAPPMESGAAEAAEEWALAASVGAGEAATADEAPTPSGMAVEPGREGAAAPRPEAALAQAMSLEEGPALQEVAGRLERIAGALREGRPIELFSSGSSDPLEVLIAGYALGYSEAFRRVSEERRKGQ